MKELIKQMMINYMETKKLKYQEYDEETLNVNFKIDDSRRYIYFVIAEDGWICFATSDGLSKNWDLNNKAMVALTIAKLNFYIRNGSFQFDVLDGEIRYKIYTKINKEMLEQDTINKLIENNIRTSINMINRHQDAILQATEGIDVIEDLLKYELNRSDVENKQIEILSE